MRLTNLCILYKNNPYIMSSDFNRKLLKRPDAFLSRLREGYQWSQNNFTKVISFVGVLLGVISIGIIFNYTQDKKEEKLLSSFYEIEKKMNQNNTENDLAQLTKLAEKNPKTKAAFFSYLKAANISGELKKYMNAIAYYEKAFNLTSDYFYKLLILQNLGYMHELSGEYAKAIGWYEKITEFKKQRIGLWTVGYRPNVFWLSCAYFGIGRCYEKLNQKENAKDAYLKVSDEFSNTIYADRARAYALLL